MDNIFLSYNKILKKLKENKVITKNNNEITHKDLRLAISVMLKKHPTCRWQSCKIRSKRYFIIFEGYLWIRYVYFNNKKSLIDSDIDFFETRIKQYESLLKVDSKELFIDDIKVEKLKKYFNRATPILRLNLKGAL